MESSQHLPYPAQSSPAKPPPAPTLRRSASHESLISISGMDIHTLKSRPSQLLLGSYASSGTTSATQISITDTSATAQRPQLPPSQQRTTSQSYLSSIAASTQPKTLNRKASRPLGGLGGWVKSRWGVGASSSTAPEATSAYDTDARSTSTTSPPTTSAGTRSITKLGITALAVPTTPSISRVRSPVLAASPQKPIFRSPGINQRGPIFGFPIEQKQDRNKVVIQRLNVDALRDSLENA